MPMRIVVLGGAGIVGRAIAADLARQVDQVVVADLDPESARAAAADAGATAQSGSVDVRDHPALVKVLQGAAACVNSVNYYFNLDVMQACLEAGVPYLAFLSCVSNLRNFICVASPEREFFLFAYPRAALCANQYFTSFKYNPRAGAVWTNFVFSPDSRIP